MNFEKLCSQALRKRNHVSVRNRLSAASASLAALSAILLASCTQSVVTSTSIQSPTDRPAQLIDMMSQCNSSDSSVIYSLPRALLPLTIKSGPTAKTPTPSQSNQIASLTAEIKALQARIKGAPATEVIALRTLIGESRAALAKLQRSIEATGFDVSVGTPVMLPDPSRTFALCYNPSALSDDDLKIELSQSGLLSEIGITADDRADDVVRKVAEGVVEVAKLAALGGGGIAPLADGTTRSSKPPAAPSCVKSYTINVLIDPTNPIAANRAIDKALVASDVPAGCVSLSSQPIPKSPGESAPVFSDQNEILKLCARGACYRRAWPVVFSVTDSGTKRGSAFMAEIPNTGPIGVVDFKRALFVKVEASAKFDKGMLTSFTYKKPSEGLAAISLPVDVIKSIVGIPAAAFETRTGATEAAATLVEAQAKLQEAQAGLVPGDAQTIQNLKNEIEILQLQSERDALLGASGEE